MQDSKNLILAIVLCLVILFGWGRLAEYMGWVQTPDPAAVAQQQEAVRQEAVKAEQHKEEAAKAATLPVLIPRCTKLFSTPAAARCAPSSSKNSRPVSRRIRPW